MENDKRSETIEKLKKAGKEEFLENGYQRASLRKICKSAGVTTGAFYFSFESKEALFKAILEPLVNQYEAMLGELMKGEIENPATGVDADKIMMQFLLAHREEVMIIMHGADGSCYENYHQRVEEFMRHSFAAYYRSQLGCEPDETLVRVLAKMRLEGAMAERGCRCGEENVSDRKDWHSCHRRYRKVDREFKERGSSMMNLLFL